MTEQSKRDVLMLVNTHVYDDPRVISEGISLIEAGYRVRIVGVARQPGTPIHGNVKGMNILLTPMVTEAHPLSFLRALWHWLRGDLSKQTARVARTNLISFLFFNLWALRVCWKTPADVIHCHDLSPLLAAWLLARRRRARLIYDSHESAPDLYIKRKAQWVARLENGLIRKPDAVITVGERLAQALRERGARRVIVVGNWKRLEDYAIDPSRLEAKCKELGLNQQIVVSYIGGLEPDREIQILLDAAGQSPEVALLIGGRGSLESAVANAAEHVPNIHWLGWVDMADIPLYTHLCDAVYYCLSSDQTITGSGNNYYITPNKLFEAFAAGKAVIATRGVGEIGDILQDIHAGILLDVVTPETLKNAFHQLQNPDTLHALQETALAAREQYHWGIAEHRLHALYDELTQ